MWFSANLALARTVQVTWVYTELPTAPGRVQPLQSLIQLALLHAPTLGCVGDGGEDRCRGGGSSGGDGCGDGRPSE